MILAPWKKSYDNLQCVKKQKSIQSKLKSSQWSSMNHKDGWCFQNVVLEKILESPLDSKEVKPVNLWEIDPEYSLEGLVLKLKLQHFGHLMQRLTHWKRPWCWERLMTEGEEGNRGLDGWMAIPTHGHEFEQTPGDTEGQWSLACCSPWGHNESDTA